MSTKTQRTKQAKQSTLSMGSKQSITIIMAAILCNGIGKVCSGTCDALGSILSLPCKACGVACDGLGQALKSPFCLYLAVTLGLNIPPVIFAGQALANNNGCNVALQWLSINAFFCIVNVAAAIYISGKVVHDPNDLDADVGNDAPYIEANMGSNNNNKTSEQQQPSSTIKKLWQGPYTAANETRVVKTLSKVSRVRDVLCYDPIVAVYIIIGICYIIWQSVGFSRMNQAAGCGGGEEELITRAVSCGFLFISLGATVFGCSVCCLR